jgi:hypothetical protein
MNDIITQRTNPNIRFKIQGIILCEKLNKHLLWKKYMDDFLRRKIDFLEKRFKDE